MSSLRDEMVSPATISAEIRAHIVEYFLFGGGGDLRDDTSLRDAGIIDSIGAVQLVTFLEAHFSLTITDEDLIPENFDSIQKMTAFVCLKLGIVPFVRLGGVTFPGADI